MLTRKQHELLMFIHERLKESGIPPSFDEMKEALDLASKSGIHRLITALEERGFIRRLPNRARALEVLRLPDSIAPGLNAAKKFSPSVIQGGQGNLSRQVKPAAPSRTPPRPTGAVASLMLCGRCNSGRRRKMWSRFSRRTPTLPVPLVSHLAATEPSTSRPRTVRRRCRIS